MITQLRLTWRLQRWDIAFVAVLCASLSAAALWLTMDMRSILARCGTPAATPPCQLVYAFQATHGQAVQTIQYAIGFVPYLAGLVLGVPVVAREVELRTAPITWSLVASRLRWLAWRVVPLLVISLVPIGVLAVAADQMAHAYIPNHDLGFIEYAGRGLPLVMRFVLTLVAGVAIGAMLGRVLPALLVGIGLSVAVSMGLGAALDHWVPSTELTAAESIQSGQVGALNTDLKFRLPDGTTVDNQTAENLIYAANEAGQGVVADPSTLPHEVFIGIAAGRYPEVLVRESAVLGLASIGVVAFGGFVVGRRRPE